MPKPKKPKKNHFEKIKDLLNEYKEEEVVNIEDLGQLVPDSR